MPVLLVVQVKAAISLCYKCRKLVCDLVLRMALIAVIAIRALEEAEADRLPEERHQSHQPEVQPLPRTGAMSVLEAESEHLCKPKNMAFSIGTHRRVVPKLAHYS